MSGMASFILVSPAPAPLSSPAKAGDPVTTVANTSQAHGVLDAPLARGMTPRVRQRWSFPDQRQRLGARAAVRHPGEVERLGQVAGPGQQILHPGELVHRDRND